MPRQYYPLIAVIAVGLLCSRYASAAEVAAPPNLSLQIELRPGLPVGYVPNAAIEKPPTKTIFEEGEPITATFIVSNRGTQPYSYFDRGYDRSGRMGEYALEVTDTQGLRQDDPRHGGWCLGGIGQTRQLAPNESFSKEICLNEWVMPLPPGKYTVCGLFNSVLFGKDYPRDTPWVRSAPLEIEIVARADMKAYVERIGHLLQTTTGDLQKKSIVCLGYTGSPEALPYLVPALFGANDESYDAFMYLRDTEACAAALLAALEEHGSTWWVDDLLQRYQVPRERTLQYVVRGLASPDREQRIRCAQTLEKYSKLGAVPFAALQDAAHDPDASVRSAAVYSLRVFKQPAGVSTVLEASHDPELRLGAVFALSCQGTDEAMARLQEMAADEPQIAHEVIRVAADSKSPLAKNVLIAALPSPDKMVRIHALAALFGLGDDNVRYTLADEMATMHPSTQAQIIEPWLFSAVGRRNLVMPKWSASQEEYGRAWVDWLRQEHLTTRSK